MKQILSYALLLCIIGAQQLSTYSNGEGMVPIYIRVTMPRFTKSISALFAARASRPVTQCDTEIDVRTFASGIDLELV